MRIDLFQSCGHCWVLQISWHTEWSTFVDSSFRILNNSAEIPSPSLPLLATVLPKAHTSHSRMSGSEWETTPSWLSGSLRSLFYSSSVYSFHLFLISSASIRSLLFLSFIVPIFGQDVPLISPIFLKRSLVLPFLLFSFFFFLALFVEDGLLVSPCYSLDLIGYSFPFLPCFHLSSFLCCL